LEEVVLQLSNCKCIPVLLYGLEACTLLKFDLSSVVFIIVRFLMKLFNTTKMDITAYFSLVWSCQKVWEKARRMWQYCFCKISVHVSRR